MPQGLLQRASEVDTLERWLQHVRDGSGAVAVVEGPAGVGKSSLLRAVSRTAQTSDVRVLRAWGAPLEQQAGWGVVRQLFAAVSSGPEWSRLRVGAAGLASRVLDPDPVAPAPPADAVHAAMHGLTWLANGLAEDSPTVLVVDDVHWADVPSTRWLALLGRQVCELRIGILCAVRSGEPPTDVAALAELLATADPPVRPRPLGPDAVETIVAERLGSPDPAFVSACHAATAGNPFLVGALLDQLAAEGLQPTAEVASRLTTFGPAQVARSVELQLARLPDGAGDLARAFAVLGRGTPLRQAAALTGRDLADAHHLAGKLEVSGLLAQSAAGYTLTHPLVASSLYVGLPAAERSLLHRTAATILATDRADPETRALHLLRAEPAGDLETVQTLRTAAGRALVRGAPETAATYLRRALAEPAGDLSLDAELHNELGLCLAAHAQPEARRQLADAVDQATSPEQRMRIALSGGRALGLAGHFRDAIELCRNGLADATPNRAPLRDDIELEMVCNQLLMADTVDAARDLLRRRAPLETRGVLWRIPAAWELMGEGCGTSQEVRRLLAPVLVEVVPPRNAESLVGTWVKFLLVANGDLDTARGLCDALIELARPQGWLIALAHGSFLRAIVLLHLGQIHQARADAQLSFEFKQANSPPAALLWSLVPLVAALTELGALAEANARLQQVGCDVDPPEACLSGALLLEARARLRLAEDRAAEAHADLMTVAGWWRQLHIASPGVAAWRAPASEALVVLGDARAAQRLAEEQLRLSERAGLAEPRAAALRALARAGHPDDAVPLLHEAVATLADSPARLELTRCQVDLGAALRRRNRREAAREPLRQALDRAEHDGMLRLAERARHELSAAGARPRRSAVSGLASLTPAERQVAALAADGSSNKEIAQRLFVSRRTVETHLTHVFAKLGSEGRGQLARLVKDPGGLDAESELRDGQAGADDSSGRV